MNHLNRDNPNRRVNIERLRAALARAAKTRECAGCLSLFTAHAGSHGEDGRVYCDRCADAGELTDDARSFA